MEVTEIERLVALDAATLWEPRVDYALRQSPQIEMVISTNASNAPGGVCEDQRAVDPPQRVPPLVPQSHDRASHHIHPCLDLGHRQARLVGAHRTCGRSRTFPQSSSPLPS